MRFLPLSLTSFLVELNDLDETLALLAALQANPPPGIKEMVPAARTLMISFAAEMTSAAELAASLSKLDLVAPIRQDDRIVEVPVDYNGEDLAEVAELTGLGVAEVIRRHTSREYKVAFCGFAPGFGYLVGGDPALHVPRRKTPRTRIPAGSVGLAGNFSGVYPQVSPGGWQLIGTTPVKMWDITRTPPAYFQPGYRVRFIDLATVKTQVSIAMPAQPADGAAGRTGRGKCRPILCHRPRRCRPCFRISGASARPGRACPPPARWIAAPSRRPTGWSAMPKPSPAWS